ncbi:uroporphyrinogen-III C-methyltransferase [Terracidiphilus sp.]|jgi:uroporphyrin-III C-methyltransferase|uniref:uroporphyrinogen-III C-methyltransferase n=1 Tax=Terracidiphilus sp. TaxID=1964191 RepID=UPI003C1CE962
MSQLPIFLQLDARTGLIVGAGAVALDKIGALLKTGIRLRVVAPEAREEIRVLAAEGQLEWIPRVFTPSDLDGIFIAIAATSKPEVNTAVYEAAVERGVLCNSVDDIPHCDFYFGSIVERGPLQVAISTSGESPAFAQRLRREIDAQLPQAIASWLTELGAKRREILATFPASESRKALLHTLANQPIPPAASKEAKVYLVGAGPGDPDLLTLRAARLIQSAQVILHDDLVPEAILSLATQAEIVNVGKRCGHKNITQEEINALMIVHARAGRTVVRLKSGDPLIFGRAAEEMSALREANIVFEVVPGITAAFAAAAAVPFSLTDRHAASSVIFSTGHHAQSHNDAPLPAKEDATLVVYMPGRDLKLLAAEWLSEGLPADLPCVLVSHAAQPNQQVRCTTLAALSLDSGDEAPLPAPSLLLAGWAVRETAARYLAEANPSIEV